MAFRVHSGTPRAQQIFKTRTLSNPAGLGVRGTTLLTSSSIHYDVLTVGLPLSAITSSFRDLPLNSAIRNARKRFKFSGQDASKDKDEFKRNFHCRGKFQSRVVSDSVSYVGDTHHHVLPDSSSDFACTTRADYCIRANSCAASSCTDICASAPSLSSAMKCTHAVSFPPCLDLPRYLSLHAIDFPQPHAYAELQHRVTAPARISEPTPVTTLSQDIGATCIRTPKKWVHGPLNTRSDSTMTMTRREEPSSTFTRTTMPAFSTTSEPASPTTFGLESEPSSLSPATSLEYRCPTSSPKMVQYQAPFYATHSSRMSVSENRPSPNQPHVSFSSSFSCAAYPAPTIQALEPYRRSPPPETRPELRIQGGSHLSDEYVLMVQLPVTMTTGLAPEMITISARKENKLAIVADVWHAENNCHLEWLVSFAPSEVNVSSSRAQFGKDGTLTIRVPRLCQQFFTRSRLL